MAGNDDGDAVHAVCSSHRALSAGGTGLCRQLRIGERFSVRNPYQLAPDALLELGSAEDQRRREGREGAVEIAGQLLACLREVCVIAWDERLPQQRAQPLELR